MKAFRFIGWILFIVCGIILLIFQIRYCLLWWGIDGVIAAVLLPPLAYLFPILYIIKVGLDNCFLIMGLFWVGSILGGIIVNISDKKTEKNIIT
jgi:hypothetical protein